MSYILNKSDGTVLVTIEDGASDSAASSLTFVGQNYVGYGEILQENLVKLLENFSRTSAPSNPIVGQLWWDTATNLLKVRVNGSTWRSIASSAAASSAPTNANIGDFWFDTTKDQVRAWTGTSWIVVGPSYERGQDTIANALVITDTLSNTHTVMTWYVNGQISAIFNPDLDFSPSSVVPGFSTIRQGLNLASSFAPAAVSYHGTAQNALTLQSLSPSDFLRSGQNEIIGGNLLVDSDNGVWVGAGGKFRATIDTLTGTATLRSHTNGSGITLAGTFNNTPVNFITSDASTGLLTVLGNPTAQFGIATKNYVDTNITAVSSVLRNDIDSNVLSINSTLGTLATEINNVNTYALNLNTLKANVNSPDFVGVPKSATLPVTTSNAALATTAFVQNVLQTSPNLSGVPTAPTRSVFTNNTAIATTEFVHRMFPLGSVIMWYGSVITIPAGWALCDGSNGTPDLRDRFVIGAGNSYNPGVTGGSKDAVVVSHSHGVNESAHTHGPVAPTSGYWTGTPAFVGQMPAGFNFSAGSRSPDGDLDGSRVVTGYDKNSVAVVLTSVKTNLSVENFGVSGTNANLPPYYALCFIMKVV